jgi:hypothetical protein
MLIKPFDFGIVLCALGAVVVSFILTYSGSNGSGMVNVRGENGMWVFPIDSSESIVVPGPLGGTVVEINGGAARITASPCLNQTCVSAGRIHSPGQWTACLPNRVMLYIDESVKNSDVDAAAW